jgi:hypothetical protein
MAKEKLSDYQGIILEALEDYKRWFDDIEVTDDDKEKIKEIDKAIKFINNIE